MAEIKGAETLTAEKFDQLKLEIFDLFVQVRAEAYQAGIREVGEWLEQRRNYEALLEGYVWIYEREFEAFLRGEMPFYSGQAQSVLRCGE